MFDNSVRRYIDPGLERIGKRLAASGITANGLTWTGFFLGVVAAIAIIWSMFIVAVVLIGLSRLLDGLDGTVARASGDGQGSDYGGYLDIVLDFAFYGMIPFAFVLNDPQANAIAGGLVLLTFYINGASFLTFALMAEKRGVETGARGSKSLLYTAGLAEASETIAFFILCCLFPHWFAVLSFCFAAIVVVTTISRFILAGRMFS